MTCVYYIGDHEFLKCNIKDPADLKWDASDPKISKYFFQLLQVLASVPRHYSKITYVLRKTRVPVILNLQKVKMKNTRKIPSNSLLKETVYTLSLFRVYRLKELGMFSDRLLGQAVVLSAWS